MVKGQTVNIGGFVDFWGHTVSVAGTQLCCYSLKEAIDNVLLCFKKIDVDI